MATRRSETLFFYRYSLIINIYYGRFLRSKNVHSTREMIVRSRVYGIFFFFFLVIIEESHEKEMTKTKYRCH